MKILLLLLFFVFTISNNSLSQSVTEKELFELTYKGVVDSYNFKYDEASGIYCYIYYIGDENKNFIISKNSLSDKYNYISATDIRFDSKGNYYVITSDYKEDYGINNYFLIANGKVIKSYNYIESYNSYVNKKDEFVFIFKEKELYYLGYYNLKSGFRQTGPYEFVRAAFQYKVTSEYMEGDLIEYQENDFFHNDNGERVFVANSEGKAKIIFETSEIQTGYSDINESSFILNKNNELSYIAKMGGRFYQYAGNEFVVSGQKKYNEFNFVTNPLLFNQFNEPVYIAGDSVMDFKNRYYLVIGNQVHKAYVDKAKTELAPEFNSYITDARISADGSVIYTGNNEVVIPAENPGPNAYDQYYQRSFLIIDDIAAELGYNVNSVKYDNNGNMLYSGVIDLNKKEILLMLNYGESKIIINRNKFDDIMEYGFTPANEIYYVGYVYEDSAKSQAYGAFLYLGDKLISTGSYFAYQGEGSQSEILRFDSKNNYAFVTEEKTAYAFSEYAVITNTGKLPFPENVSGAQKFNYISDLNYSGRDKLFYAGDLKLDTVTYDITKEIFYDNKSLKKTYSTISNLLFDKAKDQITFTGSRGSKIYFVTVQF